MSLALVAKLVAAQDRIKELERLVKDLTERIQKLEDRPRPGRPKHDRNRTS